MQSVCFVNAIKTWVLYVDLMWDLVHFCRDRGWRRVMVAKFVAASSESNLVEKYCFAIVHIMCDVYRILNLYDACCDLRKVLCLMLFLRVY